MFVGGVHGMTDLIGFKMINMICDEDDLDDTMHFMHAWVKIAGPALAKTICPNQYEYFERFADGRRYEVPAYI
jgi:hypothetical protein